MKIKTKDAKKQPNAYRKFGITKRFNIENQREKLDLSDGSKESYLRKDVMKAVKFYFQNLDPTPCFYRFGSAFLPFIADLTFGKDLD